MDMLEVTYLTRDGKMLHRQALSHFAARALSRDIQSVRLPVSYKGQKHLPGLSLDGVYEWASGLRKSA